MTISPNITNTINVEFVKISKQVDRRTIVRLVIGLIVALGIEKDVLKALRGY